MLKLVEKLEVCEELYMVGLSIKDIAVLLGVRDSKQLINHIRHAKVKVKDPIEQNFESISLVVQDLLKSKGLVNTLEKEFPQLFTKQELTSKNNFFENDWTVESLKGIDKKVTYASEVTRIKQLINKPDTDNTCSVCSNKGTIYLPLKGSIGVKSYTCPKCKGYSKNKKSQKVIIDLDKDLLSEHITNIKYLNSTFNKDILLKETPIPEQIKLKIDLKGYAELLDAIIGDFKNGKLPKNSLLLSAPDNFGKKHFVYQAIKECIAYGYNPSTILNIGFLSDLYHQNQYDQLLNELDKDILFIDLNGVNSLSPALLVFILNHCDKNSIPSIFLSRKDTGAILSRYKQLNADWLDIFADYEMPYDYGHLKNIGIKGMAYKEIVKYKTAILADFFMTSN